MDEKKKCSEAGCLFGSSQGKRERERFRTSSSSVEGKLVREERATYIQHNISNACGWTVVVVVIVFGSGLRKYSGDNWVGV
jgi:hypothetical protein